MDVLVPFYNTPIAFVRQAVESVLAQSLGNWVLLLVNDGSRPEEGRAARDLLAGFGDPRLRYQEQANRGISAARNAAIRMSDAPFLALLDADDWWYPDHLATMVPLLQANADLDLVHADVHHVDADGRLLFRGDSPTNDAGPSAAEQFAAMAFSNFISVPTVVTRRSAVETVGLFDEQRRSLEDKELWLRLLAAGRRFEHVPQVHAAYRKHGSNLSRSIVTMLRGRLSLGDQIAQLVRASPHLHSIDAVAMRRQFRRHAFREARDSCREQRDPLGMLRHQVASWIG